MIQKINTVFRWLADLFFAFVLIASITASVIVVTTDGRGGFCSQFRVFGIIRSGSMESSGLYKGDVVYVMKDDGYEVGDTIVFYRAPAFYQKSVEEADLRGSEIWIHEIVDVKTDKLGRQTFLTKGSSNLMDDVFYVPEDFVLGTAQKTPEVVGNTVRFLLSKIGVLTFIVAPSAILFVLFGIDLALLIIEDEKDTGKRVRKQKTV